MASTLGEKCISEKRPHRIRIGQDLSSEVDATILREGDFKCHKRTSQLFGEELLFDRSSQSPPISSPIQFRFISPSDMLGKTTWTSTPHPTISKNSRMLEALQEVSPICEDSKSQANLSCTILSPNKLGKPLLSSTKLHAQLDNDRLINAARIYNTRLKRRLTPVESELVTSQLLHKNAIVDTFVSAKSRKDKLKQKDPPGRVLRNRNRKFPKK